MTGRGSGTKTDTDVLVVGSGVAGLATALGLAGRRRVTVVTTGSLGSGSTGWAQGGIAAALAPGDSPRRHAEDTLTAGVDHGDPAAIAALTAGAADRISRLLEMGAGFDRAPDGSLALGREGGHHAHRVVHAGGDATGAELRRVLVAAVLDAAASGRIEVIEDAELGDLLVADTAAGRQVAGARLHQRRGRRSGCYDRLIPTVSSPSTKIVTARAVVLATGGAGGLWESTTNPAEVTGAWLGIALRAGATLTDLEFVQFHPTALATGGGDGSRRPLVTEALRGAGARLLDPAGRPLMAGVHLLGDLAPRDVVARRIDEVLRTTGASHVLLDARQLGADRLRGEFPTVWAACQAAGVDPSVEAIPVAPAQHFLCGGIRVDLTGGSDLPGLYAVGECAATGVHGANRLASNSLLEGLVFGRRLAARLSATLPEPTPTLTPTPAPTPAPAPAAELPVPSPSTGGRRADLAAIRAAMSRGVGIRRDAAGLSAAAGALGASTHPGPQRAAAVDDQALGAAAIGLAAATRTESRGCHWRDDHPATEPAWQRRRIAVRLDPDGLTATVDTGAAREAG